MSLSFVFLFLLFSAACLARFRVLVSPFFPPPCAFPCLLPLFSISAPRPARWSFCALCSALFLFISSLLPPASRAFGYAPLPWCWCRLSPPTRAPPASGRVAVVLVSLRARPSPCPCSLPPHGTPQGQPAARSEYLAPPQALAKDTRAKAHDAAKAQGPMPPAAIGTTPPMPHTRLP